MTAERRFLLPWLASAGILAAVRLLHATPLDYDITLQIQAAQNLLSGNGLTLYWRPSENLASPLTLHGLTHYAAGYSLYAAAFMALGPGPAAYVKVWGLVATLAGWLGWGRLAFVYMGDGARRGRFWRFAATWIGCVSPFLFTSRWGGTDIALWAAVPWILTLMIRAPEPRAQLELRYDTVAGFLIGVCVLIRYASLFLVPYALLLIVCQSQLRGSLLAKRLVAFATGLVPGIAIQTAIIVSLFEGSPPGGVSLAGDELAAAGTRAWERLTTLAAANQGVFFWLPGTLRFWTFDGYQGAALVLAAGVLIGLPLLLMMTERRPFTGWCYDLRIVAAGLLIVLPVFLWTCGLLGAYLYVVDRRYYEPLRPLAACIAYGLATMNVAGAGRRLAVVVWPSRAYVVAFVLITAVEMGAALLPVPGHDLWRRIVLGAEPRPWPSFGLTYEFSEARRFVLNLMKDDPAAMLITTREAWFHAEPQADRSRILREELCAAFPHVTHVSGPVRFLILDLDPGGHPEQLRWPDGQPQHHGCWPQLPGIRLVRRFADEQMRVLEADIPEGVRLEVKRAVPASE